MSRLVPTSQIMQRLPTTRSSRVELQREVLWRVEQVSAVERVRQEFEAAEVMADEPIYASVEVEPPPVVEEPPLPKGEDALFMHYQVQGLADYRAGRRLPRPGTGMVSARRGLARYRQVGGHELSGVERSAPMPEVEGPTLPEEVRQGAHARAPEGSLVPASGEEVLEAELVDREERAPSAEHSRQRAPSGRVGVRPVRW